MGDGCWDLTIFTIHFDLPVGLAFHTHNLNKCPTLGLRKKIVGLFDAFKKDPKTLYLTLSELPQPRDAAIFSISIGNNMIATAHLTTDATGIDAACRVLAHHSLEIKRCGYQKIAYKNLPDWAQTKFKAILTTL